MKKLTIGVIGAGRIGRVHANTISKMAFPGVDVCLKWVVDPVVASAEKLAAELGIPNFGADYRQVLADKEVDAVLVCSSTNTHSTITIDAANAGKHVFCEKPVDLTIAKVDEAVAAVKKAGVKLQVGFNRRFDPDFRQIRDLVRSGTIGEPHILKIISRDPAPPSPEYAAVSGGMFLDMTIHDFDMARYLVGSEVVEVYAAGAVLVDPAIGAAGDIDTALITLRFANGTIGVIDNSRKAVFGYDQRAEVLCSNGMAANSNHYHNTVVVSGPARIEHDLPQNFFMDRYTLSFEVEVREFVEAILENKVPSCGGEDGRQALVIALAAKKSLVEGRLVKTSEIVA
jgi:myo-inositol 2-dehydrogenase/D-chiro-inositol 1-dehydrogenase